MPTNKRPDTPRERFLDYSKYLLRDLNGGTVIGNRKIAEPIWAALNRATRDEFDDARKENDAAKAETAECQVELTDVQGRVTAMANVPLERRDFQGLVAGFEELSGCYKDLDDAYTLLVPKSRRFTDVVVQIHTAPNVVAHVQSEHAASLTARTQNRTDWTQMLNNPQRLNLPATVNGEIKIPERWLPPAKKDQLVKQRDAKFLRTLPGMQADPGWYSGWEVGGGGQSNTGFYVKFDQYGNIVDRLLRKDTYRPAESWADMTMWDNSTRDDVRGLVPTEVACHYDLNSVHTKRFGQGAKITYLRRYIIDVDKLRYIMYMDYCGYGNLHQLVDKYRRRVT